MPTNQTAGSGLNKVKIHRTRFSKPQQPRPSLFLLYVERRFIQSGVNLPHGTEAIAPDGSSPMESKLTFNDNVFPLEDVDGPDNSTDRFGLSSLRLTGVFVAVS
jgi:hypothetical protein